MTAAAGRRIAARTAGPAAGVAAPAAGPHPSTGSRVVLTVAHLDHTPENNDPANLRAMCQACHLSYDRELHAANRRATIAARKAS